MSDKDSADGDTKTASTPSDKSFTESHKQAIEKAKEALSEHDIINYPLEFKEVRVVSEEPLDYGVSYRVFDPSDSENYVDGEAVIRSDTEVDIYGFRDRDRLEAAFAEQRSAYVVIKVNDVVSAVELTNRLSGMGEVDHVYAFGHKDLNKFFKERSVEDVLFDYSSEENDRRKALLKFDSDEAKQHEVSKQKFFDETIIPITRMRGEKDGKNVVAFIFDEVSVFEIVGTADTVRDADKLLKDYASDNKDIPDNFRAGTYVLNKDKPY